jgi:hypothetical protein
LRIPVSTGLRRLALCECFRFRQRGWHVGYSFRPFDIPILYPKPASSLRERSELMKLIVANLFDELMPDIRHDPLERRMM